MTDFNLNFNFSHIGSDRIIKFMDILLKKTKVSEKEVENLNKLLNRLSLPGRIDMSKRYASITEIDGKRTRKDIANNIIKEENLDNRIKKYNAFNKVEKEHLNQLDILSKKQKLAKYEVKKFLDAGIKFKGKQTQFEDIDKFMERLPEKTNKAKKSILDFGRAMGGLSLMFAGQKIERSMIRLMTTTVSTFTRISKSQSEAGQGLTALGANFTMLKFSIGNAIATALQPLIPMLINIISSITNWVQENPRLTAGIVEFGLALGALMSAGGSFVLFLSGLKTLELFDAAAFVKKFKTIPGALENISRTFSVGAGITILAKNIGLDESSLDKFDKVSLENKFAAGLITAGLFGKGIKGTATSFLVGVTIQSTIEDLKAVLSGKKSWASFAFAQIVGILLGIAGFFFGRSLGALIGYNIGTHIVFAIENFKAEKKEEADRALQQERDKIKKEIEAQSILASLSTENDLTGLQLGFEKFKTESTNNLEEAKNASEEYGLATQLAFLTSKDELKGLDNNFTTFAGHLAENEEILNTSITKFNELASATNKAAKALERYNRANNGSTELTQNTTSEYMIPTK